MDDENQRHYDCWQLVPTRGLSVSKEAIAGALAFHQEGLKRMLSYSFVRPAYEHERCIKWLTLAQECSLQGLTVTRELYIGYYLNTGKSWPQLIGVLECTAEEYHRALLNSSEREVHFVSVNEHRGRSKATVPTPNPRVMGAYA